MIVLAQGVAAALKSAAHWVAGGADEGAGRSLAGAASGHYPSSGGPAAPPSGVFRSSSSQGPRAHSASQSQLQLPGFMRTSGNNQELGGGQGGAAADLSPPHSPLPGAGSARAGASASAGANKAISNPRSSGEHLVEGPGGGFRAIADRLAHTMGPRLRQWRRQSSTGEQDVVEQQAAAAAGAMGTDPAIQGGNNAAGGRQGAMGTATSGSSPVSRSMQRNSTVGPQDGRGPGMGRPPGASAFKHQRSSSMVGESSDSEDGLHYVGDRGLAVFGPGPAARHSASKAGTRRNSQIAASTSFAFANLTPGPLPATLAPPFPSAPATAAAAVESILQGPGHSAPGAGSGPSSAQVQSSGRIMDSTDNIASGSNARITISSLTAAGASQGSSVSLAYLHHQSSLASRMSSDAPPSQLIRASRFFV